MQYLNTADVLMYIRKMISKYGHYPEPLDIEMEYLGDTGVIVAVDEETYDDATSRIEEI